MAKAKYITGFCGVGLHEGTSPKSHSGTPMKVCVAWMQCACKCHGELTKMHELVGTDRVPHQNQHYSPPHNPYVMPTLEERAAFHSIGEEKPAPVQRNPLEAEAKRFNSTPTGKRARGQLEDEVLAVCSSFVRGELPYEDLTPKEIAREIDKFDPPSVGAIGAVFDRWVALGFARCDKKPVRFLSFTIEGMTQGLDFLKDKAKREAKLKQGAASRTLRARR